MNHVETFAIGFVLGIFLGLLIAVVWAGIQRHSEQIEMPPRPLSGDSEPFYELDKDC